MGFIMTRSDCKSQLDVIDSKLRTHYDTMRICIDRDDETGLKKSQCEIYELQLDWNNIMFLIRHNMI